MKYLKKIFAPLLLSGCSTISTADTSGILMFNSELNISNCSLTLTTNKTSISHTPIFTEAGECRLVTHDRTNIVNTHFINGKYIVFIENNLIKGDSCTSEYTAVGIGKNDTLFTSELIKRSGSCLQGKELNAFKYYSAKLTEAKPETHQESL